MIGYYSKGIREIIHLNAFTDHVFQYIPDNTPNEISYIAGWGARPSTINARNKAKSLGLPYISLEDGFIRSLGLGANSVRQHSLILDYSGIYYDTNNTSDLELFIFNINSCKNHDFFRSSFCIQKIKEKRLSKFNLAPENIIVPQNKAKKILVVDQTFGDVSILHGKANTESFTQMLDTAITENPGIEILVKIHPEVITGEKKGYLLEAAKNFHCTIIAEDISPWSLFDIVDHVYVVTSQMGFDALIAGKKVTCFGIPFYAGWGLTEDKQRCERRNVSRSLEQVFYAAYIQYTRYINPYTGVKCELEDTIKLISHQKAHLEKFRGNWLVSGFNNWKHQFIPDFLGLAAKVSFTSKLDESINNLILGDNLLLWSSKVTPIIEVQCNVKGVNLWRMEDGFVRSVGLGSDLIRPLSLVIDSCGIYYDATVPSDLENLLNTYHFDIEILNRSKVLRKKLVELKISKYNVGKAESLSLPSNKTVILVSGQVETDASIQFGSPIIKTNIQLLEIVRKENPDAFIVYKPHPDVLVGGRIGKLDVSGTNFYDQLILHTSIIDLFEVIDELHTMSSLAGFEALLRNKKVVTYGMPFYAGWGLTTDKLTCERRKRSLTLDQLVAATLILYPIYVDPESGDVCDVETAIHILHKQQNDYNGTTVKTLLYRLYRKLFKKKR